MSNTYNKNYNYTKEERRNLTDETLKGYILSYKPQG